MEIKEKKREIYIYIYICWVGVVMCCSIEVRVWFKVLKNLDKKVTWDEKNAVLFLLTIK